MATPSTARIDASPTKEFFIDMLTRDIPLTRAIVDLVDNSVDGARRLRPDGAFDGLWVRIEVDRNHFAIADNCGGISPITARNYAFRFGRPRDAPPTRASVGQFGVGMKRTFFKLGRHFNVASTTASSRFEVDVDVDQWLQEPEAPDRADDWHFQFKTLDEEVSDIPADEIGTRIEVDKLNPSVAESLGLASFLDRLKRDIASAHSLSMTRGLALVVNGLPLSHEPQQLFVSESLKPAFIEKTYGASPDRSDRVTVKLFAGLAERDFHLGGWYVFCNGRLVLRADHSATTIWGSPHDVRQYHADFAYFRGFAYFDSDNSALLPWTTTKTGVDIDSAIYRNVQQEMIELSKPVLSFLANLAKEKSNVENGEVGDARLARAVSTATATPTHLLLPSSFIAPSPALPTAGPRMQKIQYSKPASDVEKAKQLLKVGTFSAVGELTFDYYMRYEGGD